jgi:hypothetical protein
MTTDTPQKISAQKALFIKLGSKGKWEKESIESNILKIGFNECDHKDCLAGKWDVVRKDFPLTKFKSKSVSKYITEMQHFYEAPQDTLWITFYNQRLWWCFASETFVGREKELKTRKVLGKWSCSDINDKTLLAENLNGNLLKTQSYRGTICNVEAFDYLLNKINGIEMPIVKEIRAHLQTLRGSVASLIKQLNPKDFEMFVDLLFRESGYQRLGVIGGTQKGKDIELLSPVTHQRILVQVKAASNFTGYKEYEDYFLGMNGYDHFYYVVHSPDKKLAAHNPENAKIEIWNLERLSELTVNAGLVQWLITKAS